MVPSLMIRLCLLLTFRQRFVTIWRSLFWATLNGLLHFGAPTHLAAEGASVLAVLGDFHLLDHLTQGGTITGTIFTNDSNLLGALGLSIKKKRGLTMRLVCISGWILR